MGSGPEFVEALKLVERRARLAGDMPLSAMPRLAESLYAGAGRAHYDLSFEPDDLGKPAILGRVSAELSLPCQRCLGPMPWPVESEVRLAILSASDDVEKLDETWDPLVAGAEPISLLALIEDELILSLPISPLHLPDVCLVAVAAAAQAAGQRPNPFAILARMKKPGDR